MTFMFSIQKYLVYTREIACDHIKRFNGIANSRRVCPLFILQSIPQTDRSSQTNLQQQ